MHFIQQGWGKTIVIGLDKPDAELRLSSIDVLCSGKTLLGSFFGGLKAKIDVPTLAKRYLAKVLTNHKFNISMCYITNHILPTLFEFIFSIFTLTVYYLNFYVD